MGRTAAPENQLLALLGDDAVQKILTATDKQPMSARMLEKCCDASLTTIYRRIEELREFKLVRERMSVQPNGNHYKTYEANLAELGVTLTDGQLDIEVTHRDDAPNRFRGIWDSMQQGRD